MIISVPPLEDAGQAYPTLGPQVCAWMEDNLVFGPGDLRGAPLILSPEWKAVLYRIYEVTPESSADPGRRRWKRIAISLPKGSAKSELAALIAAAELHPNAPVRCHAWHNGQPVGRGVTDPYIPLLAYTEEQSEELVYGALRTILQHSKVADDFDIGLARIMRRGGDGKAVPLANSPNARDGARTTCQIFDETHRMTLPNQLRAHQTMLANVPKRRMADAWTLEVTTAPEPGGGSVAEKTMDYALAVRDGRAADPRMWFFHRQASDEHDLDVEEGARAAVVEALGPQVGWRDVDGIVDLWRDPTTDRKYWERVWLNRLVRTSDRAFDAVAFKDLVRPSYTVSPGALITVGFDGSRHHDATALVATEVETGYQWIAGAWECPLTAGGEWQVPEAEVSETLDGLMETYDVWRVYADPPYWQTTVAEWAGKYGDERVIYWWTNRWKQIAYAVRAYEEAISTGALSHSGESMLVRHVGNSFRRATQARDDHGEKLWTICKERPDSLHKIDVAMAAVLSWEARTDAVAAGAMTREASKYETEPLMVVSLGW